MNAHKFGHIPPAEDEDPALHDPMRCLKRCMHCGTEFYRHHLALRICGVCDDKRLAARTKAHLAVRKAIKAGVLPPINTQYCVDCGAFASLYEHRSYNHALAVQPVCRSCNQKRGPGHWMPETANSDQQNPPSSANLRPRLSASHQPRLIPASDGAA